MSMKVGLSKKLYNKSDIVQDIARKHQLPISQAELVLNVIFEEIVSALLRGHRVEIRGFGSFEVRKYKGYTGRNPQNKEVIRIKSKRLPFFKAGKIKDKLLKS